MKLVIGDSISVWELTKKFADVINKVKIRKIIDFILNLPNNEIDSHYV